MIISSITASSTFYYNSYFTIIVTITATATPTTTTIITIIIIDITATTGIRSY